MNFPLSQIAQLIHADITGDGSAIISSLAKIEEAKEGDLTFLYLPQYEKYFPETKASAIIVKKGFEKSRTDITYLEVDNPNKAFFSLLSTFFPDRPKIKGIDTSAYISPSATIGSNVGIGRNVVISDNCVIGDNCTIFHNTVLLDNVKVGAGTELYPNITIRENCIIGERVIIHSGTVIGSDGFGFLPDENNNYEKIPQVGNVVIEDDVEIGANVTVDRAMLGSTVIKKGVKLDNLIQVAHNVVIGENTVMSAQSGISGSTTVGKNCMIAGQAGLVNHIHIADRVIIGAQAGVSKSITKPGFYVGSPIKEGREFLRTEAHIRNLENYAKKIKDLEKELAEIKQKL
ncbi:MAG: UDP-3-O-(3-hydroxymyristoyl)glucosamine N-acyltransferase [Ignavibacteriaceae bacterium]